MKGKKKILAIVFGVILLVCKHFSLRSPNESELRWQAYTTLAYGSKCLGWFTYLTEIPSVRLRWYEDAVIGRDGNRTEHYAMLKRINHEILNLGPILLKLKSTGVFHTKPVPVRENIVSIDIKESNLIKDIDLGQWVVGEFLDPDKQIYMMLVNRDFTKPQKSVITFYPKVRDVYMVNKKNGQKKKVKGFDHKTGRMTINMSAGDGNLYLISLHR